MRLLPSIAIVVLSATLTPISPAAPTFAASGESAVGHPTPAPRWKPLVTGTAARLRGLAPVSRTVAWAAGSAGTVLRTTDAGRTWPQVGPPGTTDLEFRDIEA